MPDDLVLRTKTAIAAASANRLGLRAQQYDNGFVASLGSFFAIIYQVLAAAVYPPLVPPVPPPTYRTTEEKDLVGLAYDLYMQWIQIPPPPFTTVEAAQAAVPAPRVVVLQPTQEQRAAWDTAAGLQGAGFQAVEQWLTALANKAAGVP